MTMTFYALKMLYAHPIVHCAISLTFAVTGIPQAKYRDELPSGIYAKSMAASMW
jgi:hypothetical protein